MSLSCLSSISSQACKSAAAKVLVSVPDLTAGANCVQTIISAGEPCIVQAVLSNQTPSSLNGTYITTASHMYFGDTQYAANNLFKIGSSVPWCTRTASNPYDNGTTGLYGGATSTTIGGVARLGEWSQIQFPYAVVLKSYTLLSATGFNCPKTWYLAGSNDGTTWSQIDFQSNIVVTGLMTQNTYPTFDLSLNTTSYYYYRIIPTVVNANGGPTNVAIQRWYLNYLA